MSEDSQAIASDEIIEKGALQSDTIRNILYTLGIFLGGKIVQYFADPQIVHDIVAYIQGVTPDFFDPFVPKAYDTILAFLMTFFSARAIAARTAIGDIKGIYKKPEPK